MRFSLLLFFILILFNTGIDWYIYSRWMRNKMSKVVKVSYWGINTFLQCLIVTAIVLILSPKQLLSGSLAIWILFFYFAIYLPKFIYFLFSLFDYTTKKSRNPHIWGSVLGAFAALSLFVTMVYGATYTRTHAVVEMVNITSPRLPESFDGYRIVQLSDLHLENFGKDTAAIETVVSQVNELNPDVIVITGDVVNRKSDELIPYLSILSRLKAKNGVYSVLGNHDYGDYERWRDEMAKNNNFAQLKSYQQKMGWKMLNNGHEMLRINGDSIALIGIENWGEPPFHRTGNLSVSYPALNDTTYKVLLSHSPIIWDEEVVGKTNVDLVLSGHTHAGQLKMKMGSHKFSPSQWRYRYWSGLYSQDKQHLYINDGLGTVFMPMRIGSSPEISCIELRR